MRPTPRKRKARRWPLLVAAVAVLLLPVGAVALLALRGERASESEWKNLRDTAGRDKVYVNARKANKPALVVSSVTEAPEVVVNREISPPPPVPAPLPAPALTEVVAMPREIVKTNSFFTNVSKPARKTPTPWPVRVDQLDAEIRNAELEQELKEALGPAIS